MPSNLCSRGAVGADLATATSRSAAQQHVVDAQAMSAGGHFNPGKHKHGGPYDPERHAGDLGNISFNDKGIAKFSFVVGGISVSDSRPDGIIGRAVVVHAAADDLQTDPTGNSGGRVACGIIR